MKDIEPVFETIVKLSSAAEERRARDACRCLPSILAYDNYKGKIAIGRLYSGTLKKNMTVAHINRAGEIKKAATHVGDGV